MPAKNVDIARMMYPPGMDHVRVMLDPDSLAEMRGALEPFLDPELETVGHSSAPSMGEFRPAVAAGPGGSSVRGMDGFLSMWLEWLTAWETWRTDPSEFIEVDADRVLVVLEVRARPKSQDVEIPMQGANLLTFRDGKVIRNELYFDSAVAFEAAGLSSRAGRPAE